MFLSWTDAPLLDFTILTLLLQNHVRSAHLAVPSQVAPARHVTEGEWRQSQRFPRLWANEFDATPMTNYRRDLSARCLGSSTSRLHAEHPLGAASQERRTEKSVLLQNGATAAKVPMVRLVTHRFNGASCSLVLLQFIPVLEVEYFFTPQAAVPRRIGQEVAQLFAQQRQAPDLRLRLQAPKVEFVETGRASGVLL